MSALTVLYVVLPFPILYLLHDMEEIIMANRWLDHHIAACGGCHFSGHPLLCFDLERTIHGFCSAFGSTPHRALFNTELCARDCNGNIVYSLCHLFWQHDCSCFPMYALINCHALWCRFHVWQPVVGPTFRHKDKQSITQKMKSTPTSWMASNVL